MGYSHHFTKNRAPSTSEWRIIKNIAVYLIENTPMRSNSAGGYCVNDPLRGAIATYVEREKTSINEFTDTVININHKEPNVVQTMGGHPAIIFDGKGDLGSEPFVLTCLSPEADREVAPGMRTCKTNRMPYDLLVCAMLILVNHSIPDLLVINSEGGIEDWEPALRLARTFDMNARLPDTIDFDASCDPEPMSLVELWQEIPPKSQFVGVDTGPGLYF
ncbi:hypothetical protein [Marinobacter sp. F3R08]|uniref:hypothetical protein n=1 Tax=Marinobacter sp. F3R08 TaxID=2841559 RepID=UPI001C083B16|nr:hypothetical protein [Marinobacter sp. F3R08]MBU2952291.1 hypothetical protein [Marinobacter sp. F3R08]